SCTAPSSAAIDTLSLHDALPISDWPPPSVPSPDVGSVKLVMSLARTEDIDVPSPTIVPAPKSPSRATYRVVASTRSLSLPGLVRDRKSTRLNSSHVSISYAVFCL